MLQPGPDAATRQDIATAPCTRAKALVAEPEP